MSTLLKNDKIVDNSQVLKFSCQKDRFSVHNLPKTPQFHPIYNNRLLVESEFIREKCNILKPSLKINALSNLVVDEDCIVIGSIWKHMEMKRNVMKNIFAELEMAQQKFCKYSLDFNQLFDCDAEEESVVLKKSTCLSTDTLSLEDDTLRIALSCKNIDVARLINGVIVGAVGKKLSSDKFKVMEFIFVNSLQENDYEPISKVLKFKLNGFDDKSRKVAFVSGLNFGKDGFDKMTADMLFHFLTKISRESQLNICALVIAGNSVYTGNILEIHKVYTSSEAKLNKIFIENVTDSLEFADTFYQLIGQKMPIYLMPGLDDFSDACIPQRPLKKFLFPKTFPATSANKLLSNPCAFSLSFEENAVTFLGTSGENVYDLLIHSSCETIIDPLKSQTCSTGMELTTEHLNHVKLVKNDILDCMDRHILWGHISPGSPDSLETLPVEKDVFVMREFPNVYFCGNQPFFGYRKSKFSDTTLLSIPNFIKSKSIAVFNLHDSSCKEIFFDTNL